MLTLPPKCFLMAPLPSMLITATFLHHLGPVLITLIESHAAFCLYSGWTWCLLWEQTAAPLPFQMWYLLELACVNQMFANHCARVRLDANSNWDDQRGTKAAWVLLGEACLDREEPGWSHSGASPARALCQVI